MLGKVIVRIFFENSRFFVKIDMKNFIQEKKKTDKDNNEKEGKWEEGKGGMQLKWQIGHFKVKFKIYIHNFIFSRSSLLVPP